MSAWIVCSLTRPVHRALLAAACTALLAACAGGSGSSGFDVRAENFAIDAALDTNECIVNEGLIICPSGSGAPTATPTSTGEPRTATPTPTLERPDLTASATPTATATPPPPPTRTSTRRAGFTVSPSATPVQQAHVDTNLDGSDVVECIPDAADACIFLFTFQPVGFPATASYEIAYRRRNPDSEWFLVAAPSFFAPITLEPGAQYQFSVLVYENGPPSGASGVDALGVTGATYAFVTPVLVAQRAP